MSLGVGGPVEEGNVAQFQEPETPFGEALGDTTPRILPANAGTRTQTVQWTVPRPRYWAFWKPSTALLSRTRVAPPPVVLAVVSSLDAGSSATVDSGERAHGPVRHASFVSSFPC